MYFVEKIFETFYMECIDLSKILRSPESGVI